MKVGWNQNQWRYSQGESLEMTSWGWLMRFEKGRKQKCIYRWSHLFQFAQEILTFMNALKLEVAWSGKLTRSLNLMKSRVIWEILNDFKKCHQLKILLVILHQTWHRYKGKCWFHLMWQNENHDARNKHCTNVDIITRYIFGLFWFDELQPSWSLQLITQPARYLKMIVIKWPSVSVTAYLSSNWNAPQLEILTSSVSAVVPPLSRAQPLTTTICPVSWVTPLSLMQEVPGNRPSLVTQIAFIFAVSRLSLRVWYCKCIFL